MHVDIDFDVDIERRDDFDEIMSRDAISIHDIDFRDVVEDVDSASSLDVSSANFAFDVEKDVIDANIAIDVDTAISLDEVVAISSADFVDFF